MTTKARRLTICGVATGSLGLAVIMFVRFGSSSTHYYRPPYVQTSTINLNANLRIEMEQQTYYGNDVLYKYKFRHNGQLIASSEAGPRELDIERGSFGDTAYFSWDSQIHIYRQMRWVTWNASEVNNKIRWNARNPLHVRRLSPGLNISSFDASGKRWIIFLDTLLPSDALRNFNPPTIHVLSHDHGKNWQEMEHITMQP